MSDPWTPPVPWDDEGSEAAMLLELMSAPSWHARAACLGMGADLFFPVLGESISPEARALCATCPASTECMEAGMYEHFGVWGGTSEKQRNKLRRNAPGSRRQTGLRGISVQQRDKERRARGDAA